jgi:hypothetical protein
VLVRFGCRASILGQATAVGIVEVVLLQRVVLHDEQQRVCRARDGATTTVGVRVKVWDWDWRYESESTFPFVPASVMSYELQSLDLFLGGGGGANRFVRFLVVLRPWSWNKFTPCKKYLRT